MPHQGKFIVFEGGEGSGKSTQASRLNEFLQQRGIVTLLTREPGGTKSAELIRKLLVEGSVDKWVPLTELLLYIAARVEHIERVIKPALQQGTWVICDRFTDSTIAYQGYGHGLDIHTIQQLHALSCPDIAPDITLLLDIDAKDGLERANLRQGSETRYEQMHLDFHQRIREGFLKLAKNSKTHHIFNATDSIQDLAHSVEKIICDKFSL